ncbi:putative fluoride ion transporter CrcB [Fervidicola ferrireducens]|uniref:Fluoride-specific ion channel FluC n=1 Tax=Fervidicola ferrireducens TaxID=520764 RepID=A0A140L7X0_9FIRM|nr:fluoride efflux transporter CrcB [Fervidicola ferrireducens]KXG76645.1 putative fluoride ion transporter CrcB [Fervidicola ferrireducens]
MEKKLVYLFIALGGAAGALFRYFMSVWLNDKITTVFPIGTLVVNLLGSFLVGLIYSISMNFIVPVAIFRSLIMVGFLGAFTTFSTFSLETLLLIHEGSFAMAFLNMLANILGGLIAVFLGISVTNLINVLRGLV